MKKRDLIAIGCKFMALYCIVCSIPYFELALKVISMSISGVEGFRIDAQLKHFWTVLLPFGMLMALTLILFFGASAIARRFAGEEGGEIEIQVTGRELFRIGVSLLGLFIVAQALPLAMAKILQLIVLIPEAGQMGREMFRGSTVTDLVSHSLKTVIGILMFIGPGLFVRIREIYEKKMIEPLKRKDSGE
jgi:hypothetical protein